jgi:protein-disulfide isomerase
MSAGTMPDNAGSCAHPLNQIATITRRFQIQATPAIFLSNGQHIGGMRSAADIEKALASVK